MKPDPKDSNAQTPDPPLPELRTRRYEAYGGYIYEVGARSATAHVLAPMSLDEQGVVQLDFAAARKTADAFIHAINWHDSLVAVAEQALEALANDSDTEARQEAIVRLSQVLKGANKRL